MRREDTLDNTPVEAIQDLAGLQEQARGGCRRARVHIPAIAERENIICCVAKARCVGCKFGKPQTMKMLELWLVKEWDSGH
jgi:hypothetical protein